VKDERGRGQQVGRQPYTPTRATDRKKVPNQPGTEDAQDLNRNDDEDSQDVRSGRVDRGANRVQRHSVGLKNPSTTGGKIGQAAERRDNSREPENP